MKNSIRDAKPTSLPPTLQRRSINWMESTARAIEQSDSRLDYHASLLVTESLSALLLARIPSELGIGLLALLPLDAARDLGALSRHAKSEPDYSIGYIQFVEATRNALGNHFGDIVRSEISEDDIDRRIANSFLWAIGRDIPAELKAEFVRELPAELKSRMNLYSAHSDDDKVA